MDTIRRTGARRILDIGSNDGIIAIPILRSFPTLDYTAVEASAEVQGWLKANLAQFKLDATVQDTLPDGCFDLIICFELIEHVPDPVEFLKTLAARLNPKGLLLLTTPYGSFDAGHPPALTAHGTPRDSRSHLRAFTIKTLVEAIEAGGLIPLELSRMPTVSGRMEGMHAAAILPEGRKPQGPAFIVPFAMWKWNASVVREQGMGGSEEMIVELSAAMARDYQPVEVFGPVADPEVKDQVYFWPKEQLSSLRNSPDRVIVAVREPGIGPGIQALAPDSKRFLWLQDTIYPELNPQSASFFNRIIATTHWHKNHLCTSYSLDLQQVKVIPNFLMADHFTETNIQRQPYHFVYASSPDRGLLTLLELWPRILERWPEASLDIFYGWRGIETLGCHPQNAKAVATLHHFCSEKMQQKGICERGMVNARTLARELQRASIWAYPTAFEEAFCITAIKARAAGCIPVTSRLAALTETAACSQAILLPPAAETGEEVYAEAFIEGIEQALQTTSLQRQQMQEEAIEQFRYERALLRWRQVLWGKS
jgi:SAM-dependent methyltransferase/glycosyltransferase involved in cell wall biosynthesis